MPDGQPRHQPARKPETPPQMPMAHWRNMSALQAHVRAKGEYEYFRVRKDQLRQDGLKNKALHRALWEEFGQDYTGVVPFRKLDTTKPLEPPKLVDTPPATADEAAIVEELPDGLNGRAIEWVAGALELPNPDPKDAPSRQAWNWLKWARTNPATKAAFWNTVAPVLARKIDVEAEDKFRDTGETAEEITDRILTGIGADDGS